MAKKVYTVNVHYDYCVTVDVIADEDADEDDILELAEDMAETEDKDALEFCEFIEACVTNVKDVEK